MPVHLYGQCADMDRIQQIADKHGLVVIEDAAQAHGAEIGGTSRRRHRRLACFSFYPGKNLGAYGEGGLVSTADAALAHKVRMLRDWGQDRKYNHAIKGLNYRMDGVQGAVLDVKMRHVEAWTEARRKWRGCTRRRSPESRRDPAGREAGPPPRLARLWHPGRCRAPRPASPRR